MRREPTSELPVKDWVQRVTVASDITLRSRLVTFLLSAYGGLLVGTMALFFLQGFRRQDSTSKRRPCTGWGSHDRRDRRTPDHDVRLFLRAPLTKYFSRQPSTCEVSMVCGIRTGKIRNGRCGTTEDAGQDGLDCNLQGQRLLDRDAVMVARIGMAAVRHAIQTGPCRPTLNSRFEL